MARIEIDSSLIYHAKTEVLMTRVGCNRLEAVGHLVFLWTWCGDHSTGGVLPKMSDSEIAAACQYFKPTAKGFVDALVEAGFLDRVPGALAVHDWREWLPAAAKKKIKRRTNVRTNGSQMSGQTAAADDTTGESLSLPSSKPLEETKTTTETSKPSVKAKSPHVEYVDRFKAFYELKVGRPFKYGRAQFVLAAKLIKDHGAEELIARTMILAKMCADRSMWFTKNGWADFSIEKLSNQWNSIIGEAIVDEKAELHEGLRKVREQRERTDRIMGK